MVPDYYQPTNDYAVLVAGDGHSNPYVGDTSTDDCHPILCVNKTGVDIPRWFNATYNTYLTWTPGGALGGCWCNCTIGFTKPILGRSLASLEDANEICEETFG